MRRTLLTKWIMAVVCAVCVTVLLNWQSKDGAAANESFQQVESSVVTQRSQHHQEATLTDASQLYRICSSRPQRVLPVQGAKTDRSVNTFGNFAIRQHRVKPLYSYHDSRCRLETAPFCMPASSDYYVIALRHIIR